MVRKVLEGICSEHGVKTKSLKEGLKKLLDQEIIDKKIYEWGDELRKSGNLAAHTTDKDISKEDAEDLLTFANAICDYVFILSNRFHNFMRRRREAEKREK